MQIEPITSVLILLLVVSIVSIIVRRIKLPYSIALVLTGLAMSFLAVYHGIKLTPTLLFTIFLPPLLFEAAINMNVELMIRYRKSISILSFAGTTLIILIVGGLLHQLLHIPLAIALLFGALISPTDPISVLSIFKESRINQRLTTIISSEALFNNGVGVVFFKIILALVLANTLNVVNGLYMFLTYTFGGVIIGLLLGYILSKIMEKIEDHLVEIVLTTIIAYGSYILAENLQTSGVMAVVASGLVISYYSPKIFNPTEKVSIIDFWSYIAFILNSIIFLLIGLEIKITTLIKYSIPILMVIAIVLLSRAIVVYLLSIIINKVGRHLSLSWQTIIVWSGIYGSLSMVLALALPESIAERELLLALTFGVVLFSIVVQGMTLKPLINFLKLGSKQKHEEYETYIGQLLANKAATEELDRLYKKGLITKGIYKDAKGVYDKIDRNTEFRIKDLLQKHKYLEKDQLRIVQSVTLDAGKNAIRQAHMNDLISEDVMKKLIAKIDEKITELRKYENGNGEEIKEEINNEKTSD